MALAVLLAVLQAAPLPPPDSVNRFRLTVQGGVISGSEEYRFEQTARGRRLTGTIHVQRPNGPLDITQVQSFGPDGTFDRYHIDVTAPTGPQVLEATRVGGGDSVRIEARAGDRAQARTVALAPRAVVLDNLVISHYQVLIDRYNATRRPNAGRSGSSSCRRSSPPCAAR